LFLHGEGGLVSPVYPVGDKKEEHIILNESERNLAFKEEGYGKEKSHHSSQWAAVQVG
jgi:hypothetical protein